MALDTCKRVLRVVLLSLQVIKRSSQKTQARRSSIKVRGRLPVRLACSTRGASCGSSAESSVAHFGPCNDLITNCPAVARYA